MQLIEGFAFFNHIFFLCVWKLCELWSICITQFGTKLLTEVYFIYYVHNVNSVNVIILFQYKQQLGKVESNSSVFLIVLWNKYCVVLLKMIKNQYILLLDIALDISILFFFWYFCSFVLYLRIYSGTSPKFIAIFVSKLLIFHDRYKIMD